MKKAVIIALVCVNVALLMALTWQMATPARAQDEGYYPPTNYVLVAGQIESGYELVYIIDMASRQLAVIRYDLSREVLVPFTRRDLASDFRESR